MKIVLKIFLGCFLLFMICFYFKRYYFLPLDGDLPGIVLPTESYQPVMKDPFGLNVLLHDSVYAATNRYFTHAEIKTYFRTVPLLLQKFFSPIDSVYIAAALARTITQFFLIYIIACYACRKSKIYHFDFLLAASICVPLFQTYDYYAWIAIIDSSVTYTFFYAFSLSLVMLYFLPFYKAAIGRRDYNLKWPLILALAMLAIIISFSGPLNAPVILLIIAAFTLRLFIKNYISLPGVHFLNRVFTSIKNLPRTMLGLFTLTLLICLYSFYIGLFNLENFWATIPLSERYARLLSGFWFHYTSSFAQPMLIGIVLLNAFLIYRLRPDEEASRVMKMLKWFGVLSIMYLLLLPIGGYRTYRSNIIRFDTVMPITIGLIFFYAYSTVYIFNTLRKKSLLAGYSSFIIIFCAVYIYADWGLQEYNTCERAALEQIANSDSRLVEIDVGCSVLSWEKITIPKNSLDQCTMMLEWNIITEQKLYYQK